MKTRKTTLMLALAAAASAVSFAASAVILNPDNDSGTYFEYRPNAVTAAVKPQAALPRVGEVSTDGLTVYSGSDRGWVGRTHTFEFVAGGFVHASNCLAYNAPTPIAAIVPIDQRGAFGDHGA